MLKSFLLYYTHMESFNGYIHAVQPVQILSYHPKKKKTSGVKYSGGQ